MAQSAMARCPEIDWERCLSTVKLAIMVKDNIQVEKLVQPKPEREDLDYAAQPHYEPPQSDEKTAEKRQREQRNRKRGTDWQNGCKTIEEKGPMVDNIPWDDADNKAKSLIYLSLGAEATNIFHQRFPHTDLQKCTTDALVEQLKEAFTQTRYETFDRFQFFRCQQKEGESLEVFHSRIKKHATLCNWEHLEKSQVKSLFTQGMRNQQIQMDLLYEDSTPSETLNYALARERGQANQQKMKNSQSPIHADNPWFEKVHYIKRQNRGPLIPTPQTGQIQNCRRCGNKFLPGYLNICPAKIEACRICKKIGHFAKLCRSEMPPRPTFRPQQRQQQNNTGLQPQQRYNQLAQRQTQQKIRNTNEESETDEQTEIEETTTQNQHVI